jgi:L-rhamnose-H+ transport protein
VSNTWGLLLREWKGVSAGTKLTIGAGIFAILTSVVMVGYGNSITG